MGSSMHLDGRKHQRRINLTYCNVCDVRATSNADMIQHLRGTRHQVAMLAMPGLHAYFVLIQ